MDKIIELSNEILSTAISSLSGEFTYFAYPIGLLDFKITDGVKRVATNGKSAYIDQNYAVEITASQGVKGVSTAVLHAILHCLFTHPFVKVENEEKYDLSCDIVVGFAT